MKFIVSFFRILYTPPHVLAAACSVERCEEKVKDSTAPNRARAMIIKAARILVKILKQADIDGLEKHKKSRSSQIDL